MNAKTGYLTISLAGKREHPNLKNIHSPLHSFFSETELFFNKQGYQLGLHLLSGLADGADMGGVDSLLQWKKDHAARVLLASIFPFEKIDYLKTIQEKEKFETLCSFTTKRVILDGRYLPNVEGDTNATTFARSCRTRAYRQQAKYLLEASGILLAITDEFAEEKEGGTLETIEEAIKKGLTVIFLSLNDLLFYIPSKPGDLKKIKQGDKKELEKSTKEIAEKLFAVFKI